MFHIPGPNPIVSPRRNDNTSWSNVECEIAGGVVQHQDECFLVYHCLSHDSKYQVGLSSAVSPLGPWTPVADLPLLSRGPSGAWDDGSVASFNMIPDARDSTGQRWLGWYEGSRTGGAGAEAGMQVGPQVGLAVSENGPRGPWKKRTDVNPVLTHQTVCANKADGGLKVRSFDGKTCGGMYVASVHYGAHTNFSYWVYMEAPVNANDEGPLALWKSDQFEGPYAFVAVVLDGGIPSQTGPHLWDGGRYSESRVDYLDGVWHIFATGSQDGKARSFHAGGPSKYHESIGWAVSDDGVNFQQYPANPIARFDESSPHTLAIAEGHSFFDPVQFPGLVFVFHTLRWDNNLERNWIDLNKGYYFVTPDGDSSVDGQSRARNAEDLAVEVFAFSSAFHLPVTPGMPIITHNWNLGRGITLQAGGNETSVTSCEYDWATASYCPPIKSVVSAYRTGTDHFAEIDVLPRMTWRIRGEVDSRAMTALVDMPYVRVEVHTYDYNNGVGMQIDALDVELHPVGSGRQHNSSSMALLEGITVAQTFAGSDKWIVAFVRYMSPAGHPALQHIELFLGYDSR